MSISVAHHKRHCPGSTFDIARPSILGNPFRMRHEEERAEVIEKYKRWLWEKIRTENADVMRALMEIIALERENGHVELLCWCSPKPCHGDIIVKACEWLKGEMQRVF